jgi:hypothetical protein
MNHSKNRQQLRGFLFVFQVALALLSLVTSGLLIRTFRNLHDPGFTNAQELHTVRIEIPEEQVKEPERVMRMEQAMLDNLNAINGVMSLP